MKRKKIHMPVVPLPPAGNHDILPWSEMQEHRHQRWERIARQYEANHDDFYAAFRFLNNHPAFYRWPSDNLSRDERYLIHDRGVSYGLDMMVVKVNPKTRRIDKPNRLNTKTEVWLELMVPWWGASDNHVSMHWWEADIGGDTYDQAVIRLARNVHKLIGNDRRQVDKDYPPPDIETRTVTGDPAFWESLAQLAAGEVVSDEPQGEEDQGDPVDEAAGPGSEDEVHESPGVRDSVRK